MKYLFLICAWLPATSAMALLGPTADQVSFPTGGSYKAIQPDTDNAGDAIKDIDEACGDYGDSIASNTADIATNTADIATNTADIATSAADIAANTAAIASAATNNVLSGISLTRMITGFDVSYDNTTNTTISIGQAYVTDTWLSTSASATHTVDSLASTNDFHYIYIDYSASTGTPTSAVFVDSTTEPAESATLGGWYNGQDRCVGAVYSPTNGATITPFALAQGRVLLSVRLQAASEMEPDGNWDTPNVNAGAGILPVGASRALVSMSNGSAAPAYVTLAALSKEAVDAGSSAAAAEVYTVNPDGDTAVTGWLAVGASRELRVMGSLHSARLLNAWVVGWEISR